MQLVLQALCAFLHQVRSLSNCRLALFANHLSYSTLLDTSLPPSPSPCLLLSIHAFPFDYTCFRRGGVGFGGVGVLGWKSGSCTPIFGHVSTAILYSALPWTFVLNPGNLEECVCFFFILLPNRSVHLQLPHFQNIA